MNKRMKIMLVSLAVLFSGIFGFKLFKAHMIKQYIASMSHVVTVSTIKVKYGHWQPQLTAAGSLRATQGVDVTTQMAGLVQSIDFTPGAKVKKGDLLVRLNADPEIAQLHSLEANAALAKSIYKRDKAQYAIGAISKVTLDTDFANLKSTEALAAQQGATVAEKVIRAPFTGRLGICQVNLGQYISAGTKIVSLQALDPIYVDFYLPQQNLVQVLVGQAVHLTTNTFPDKVFSGKISTIDSAIDTNTRNVEIEATLANPQELLTPGMFGEVTVDAGVSTPYLTVPQTAVTFNSYGNIIYLVEQQGKDAKGHPQLVAKQKFVTTGETRGDQITVLKGLKEGDEIVTSGQVKLRNDSPIVVNNTVMPDDSAAPKVSDD